MPPETPAPNTGVPTPPPATPPAQPQPPIEPTPPQNPLGGGMPPTTPSPSGPSKKSTLIWLILAVLLAVGLVVWLFIA